MASGGNGANDLFLKMLHEKLQGVNGPLYKFYSIMFGNPYTMPTNGDMIRSCKFHPDISGYTLIFLQPPDLSGYKNLGILTNLDLSEFTTMVCFLAVDFTPPPIQVTASELPSRSGSLPYAMEVSGTGQLSISFLDDQYGHCFGYHKTWISYIEDITRGIMTSTGQAISPDPTYILPPDSFGKDVESMETQNLVIGNDRFGQIDYMTTAYVIKFKPVQWSSFQFKYEDITYVGKATGIFPINNPDKEVIGRRDSNEIVTLTYNYPCANYRAWSAGTPHSDQDSYLKEQYLNDISIYYGGGINLLELILDGVSTAVSNAASQIST